MKRRNEQKGKTEIDGVQNWIPFKINVDLLQTSIAFSFKRKVKGNRKVRKKETKEEQLQIKSYSTQTEFRIDLNLFFDLIQNSIAFSHLV